MTATNGQRIAFPCEVIGVLASTTSNQDSAPPNLHVLLPYTYFVLSVSSIAAVGIASGFMPALKAEKLEVIEALRSE